MSVKSEVPNWKFSTFLENNNNKFNKNEILNVLYKKRHGRSISHNISME